MKRFKWCGYGLGLLAFSALASCSKTSQQKIEKPNVLFISVDDLNDWVGAAGMLGHPDVKTPNLDRLAKRGVYFNNAHCSSVACTPSRLSVISGLSPNTTGCYTNTSGVPDQETWKNHLLLQSNFRQSGYHVMGCGKIEGHAGMQIERDFDHQKLYDERRLRVYGLVEEVMKDGGGYGAPDFYPFPMGGSAIKKLNPAYKGHSLCAGAIDRSYLPDGKMPDEINVEWAIERLQRDYEKPFFMGIGFLRPHVPYTAPQEFFDLYPIDEIQIPQVPDEELKDIPLYGKAMAYGVLPVADEQMVREVSDTYRKELVQGYLACVSFMDAQLGKLLDALDNSDYANNTIVVLWSDHGQSLGEKYHWRKQCLWNESTISPLLWVVPGITAEGAVNDQAVSLMDIYPTLSELCQLKPQAMDGMSLLPLLSDVEVKREIPAVITWSYGSHAIKDERWRYIRYHDGTEELYDCISDYEEHKNLISDPELQGIVDRLRQYLPTDAFVPLKTSKEFEVYNKRVEQWTINPELMPEFLR